MRKNIEKYLKKLELYPQNDLSIVSEILEYISSLNTLEIDGLEKEVGQLFCRCVAKINQDATLTTEFANKIVLAFDNIKSMTVENRNTSELKTIYLLQKVFNSNSNGDFEEQDEDVFKDLLENLEKIRIIFKIKSEVENKYFFPISKLLFNVINCNNLIAEINQVKTIQALMLALQIFDTDEYSEEMSNIRNIVSANKLKFVEYLFDGAKRIGGEDWKENYEKNGVLILYNEKIKQVLIRNNDYGYFQCEEEILSVYGISEIKREINANKEEVAFYCEYDIANSCFVNIIDELKKEENLSKIVEFLKIVYDKAYYNVFSENALMLLNNELRPVNPFGLNDLFCIYGDLVTKDKDKFVYEKLKKVGILKLVGTGINYINLGQIALLEKINRVSISEIGLLDANANFNTVLKKWLLSSDNKISVFNAFFKEYKKELSFTENAKKLISKDFDEDFLLPYKIDISIMDDLGFNEEIVAENIKICIFEQDFIEEKLIITEKANQTDYSNFEVKDSFDRRKDSLNGEILTCIDEINQKIYIGHEVDVYSKILESINDLNTSMLPETTINAIQENHIVWLKKYFKMYEKTWKDLHCGMSIESILRYRFAFHSLLLKFNNETIRDWFYLLDKHDYVDYSIVKGSIDTFEIEDKGILFVLKDRSRAQSTLKYINSTYIESASTRSKIDLYDQRITQNDYYYVNENKIEEIYFVFDLIQNASATIDTLKYYLSEDVDEDDVHMSFFCNGRYIRIRDIIEKNKPKIIIYSIYAAESGLTNINEYLSNYEEISFEILEPLKRINSLVDNDDLKRMKKFYGGSLSGNLIEGEYMVIREFNQPKHNIMSKKLMDPNKMVAVLVKRDELKRT